MNLIVVFLVFVCGLTPAWAQDPALNATESPSQLQSSLNLSEDQMNAVMPILEKYASQRQGLLQNTQEGTEPGVLRLQIKQLRRQERQELSKFLSAAQLSQWDARYSGRHRHIQEDQGAQTKENDTHGTSS